MWSSSRELLTMNLWPAVESRILNSKRLVKFQPYHLAKVSFLVLQLPQLGGRARSGLLSQVDS